MKSFTVPPSFRTPMILISCVLALTLGVVASSWMLSRFMLRIQHTTEKIITVKGVAERTVRADLGTFSCTVSVKSTVLENGYAGLAAATRMLRGKLAELGFNPDEIEDDSIDCSSVSKTVKIRENGKETSTDVFDYYLFIHTLRVRTARVDVMAQNAFKIYDLAAQKINISVTRPEYYISAPEQYKLELVDEASAAAAQRAATVAQKCGSRLGALLTARQGVIQITRPASNDTTDYGVYDTTSVDKVMRLVMTMDFALK
ncbi:hypothetical protein SDC9_113878 [bioreactor metagenome]|uniref:SIMPL domain-containing protein n=1 Tax=bioreactor metagenome TaxID=1076179 RepID=A0A645BZ24_9ZZZZ